MAVALSSILPSGIVAAEIEDVGQPIALHPDEAGFVERSGDKRRRDFALGRFCAHAALARLGFPDTAIAQGSNGAPIWPEGVAGSITHTRGYAAALVGHTNEYLGVGVDAEWIGGVTENLYSRLFTAPERTYLSLLNAAERRRDATLLFSAKEAVYKAWNVLPGGKIISFQEIDITLTDDGFSTVLATGTALGRFITNDDLAITVVWVPRL